jgi:hypothetical protein
MMTTTPTLPLDTSLAQRLRAVVVSMGETITALDHLADVAEADRHEAEEILQRLEEGQR